MTYKVDLDIYNGPMDLLLYLIRREEVDIRDIPIARIADQYLAYMDVLVGLDIELAGDFLVMAATLVELKTRALLPRPPAEEDTGGEAEEDPRETLIRQLLEYRRFKEAALALDDRGRDMERRFPRQVDTGRMNSLGDEADNLAPQDVLQGVGIWDLISAFSQVVRTLGYSQPREVVYDDTPVEEVARQLQERLKTDRSLLFTDLFRDRPNIQYCIVLFLAILELVRQRRIGFEQSADFKALRVFARDPSAEPPPVKRKPRGAQQSADALQRGRPRRPTAHQVEALKESMDEADLEKTEFDEILDSITVTDVEVRGPVYSDDELLGRTPADEEPATEAAPAAGPSDVAPETAPADGTPPPEQSESAAPPDAEPPAVS